MKITFADKELEKLANDDRTMLKVLGKIRASIFRRRLIQMLEASTLEDLRLLPGNYHELRNDRRGQWACDLGQPYRLVFTPHEHPIPSNKDGQFIWIKITGLELLEITNYHKEK